MPLKHYDPFATKVEHLDTRVNPYVALLREATASGTLPIVHGPQLKELTGRWREHLAAYYGLSAPHTKLVVEIGCHKGLTLLEMAQAHPDTAFIGVDITFKRVVTSAQRALAAGLRNVYCVMANAASIDLLFAPEEIDGVVMFFPDPWVKKASQAKNRLVGAPFCGKLATVLADQGFFWLKTDQQLYFNDASAHLNTAGFTPIGEARSGILTDTYLSTFEKRFHAQNLPTYAGQWARPAEPQKLALHGAARTDGCAILVPESCS